MPDHNPDKFGQKIGLCQIFSGQKAQNFAEGIRKITKYLQTFSAFLGLFRLPTSPQVAPNFCIDFLKRNIATACR
jgi:hypothetical protein